MLYIHIYKNAQGQQITLEGLAATNLNDAVEAYNDQQAQLGIGSVYETTLLIDSDSVTKMDIEPTVEAYAKEEEREARYPSVSGYPEDMSYLARM